MKDQFEVWNFKFEHKGGDHPVVLISHPDICARQKYVNVLFCTSPRQSRRAYVNEVMLDKSDGMDWETLCDCSMMWAVESSKLFNKRGRVSLERRRAIRALLRDLFLLGETD
jgi:hypothetical protein